MKKKYYKMICCLIASLLFLSAEISAAQINNEAVYPVATDEIPGWPESFSTASETAVVMDADTGTILYNKGMDELRYPASITKIMTALLTLEHCNLEDQVVFTEECLGDQTYDSSNAGIQVGEILTVRQCLMLLMLKSANDVATQLGVHISGSVEAFSEMMNARAQELGCTNTHFVNASGMPDENHYTTAYDMALIFREAIKNETFLEIIGTINFDLEPTNMNGETRNFRTHHEMIVEGSQFYYEGCFGGKTGGSEISKNTLVTGAVRDGITLIVVSMRTDIMSIWADHVALLDYGFRNFKHEEVPGGVVTIPVNVSMEELTTQEQQDGENIRVNYFYQNTAVGTGIKEKEPEITEEPQENPEKEEPGELSAQPEPSGPAPDGLSDKDSSSMVMRYIIYGLISINILGILFAVIGKIKKRKQKKRRKNKK